MSQGTSCGWCVSIRRGRCLAHSGQGWLQSFFQPKAFVNGCIMMQNDDLSEPKKNQLKHAHVRVLFLWSYFVYSCLPPKSKVKKNNSWCFYVGSKFAHCGVSCLFIFGFRHIQGSGRKQPGRSIVVCPLAVCIPQWASWLINVEVEFWRCGSLEHSYDAFLRKTKLWMNLREV